MYPPALRGPQNRFWRFWAKWTVRTVHFCTWLRPRGKMVPMNDIYEVTTRWYDVTGATAARVQGPARDAQGLEVVLARLGVFVETPPQPPYGIRKILGWFSSLLEARGSAWAWLTGPYGVVRGIRFTKITPSARGVDLEVLTRGIRTYLEGRSAS